MPAALALADLRRYAVARTLFAPTTLRRAIDTLGFVQADPIRAPARAQDLTLRHRVKNYRAGDLERRYPNLPVEDGLRMLLCRRLPWRYSGMHQYLVHTREEAVVDIPGLSISRTLRNAVPDALSARRARP